MKMGTTRIEYIPTKEDTEIIEKAALAGLTYKQMAEMLEIGEASIEKYYGDHIRKFTNGCHSNVATTIYQKAMAGDNTMLIWYSKARMGWSEKQQLELNGQIDVFVDAARQESADEWLARVGKSTTPPAIDHEKNNSQEVKSKGTPDKEEVVDVEVIPVGSEEK
jgi:hypothetical protein